MKVLPSQSPRTTRVAAFRNGPRRRHRGSKAALAVLLVAAVSTGLWWFWPDPERARAGDAAFNDAAPVTLDLQDPSPARTPQRAVQDVGNRRSGEQTQPEPKRTADTIAASPESRPATVSTKNPPPVEVHQSLSGARPGARQGAGTGGSARNAGPDPRLATNTPSPTNAAPAPTPIPATTSTEPATPSTTTQPQDTGTAGRDSTVGRFVSQGEQALNANRPVDARIAFNRALHSPGASAAERSSLRARIAELNQKLLFSPVATPGDALVETYSIQSGDRLAKIVDNHDLNVDWRLVQRVNGIKDPARIRIGQKLKLVYGPFHAVAYKREYRLDIYSDRRDPDGNRLYIRSFSVGLGEHDSTPTGKFVVKSGSKLIDPHWVNPRTGQRFSNTDPLNPIGERWIGIEGADAASQALTGYGLHGTIEPQSIGQDASMGCVRMLAEDIELVYELLAERASTVEIRP